MNTSINFWSHLAQFFLEWEMFQKKSCRESQNTHFMLNILLFSKIVSFMRYLEKWCTAGQTTLPYSAYGLYAAYLRLQTHTQNM